MNNKRDTYSTAQQTALVSQVNRVCPLCSKPLFYKKGKRSFKDYQLAHIYPLNPTSEEAELLRNEKRLSQDINDEKNIIPLCKICHGKIDNPRTVEEYRELYQIKEKLIKQTAQEEMWNEYKIEDEITKVIKDLYTIDDISNGVQIEFEPKKVEQKLDDTINNLTKRKIKNHVSEYYVFIRNTFAQLDQSKLDLSEIISLQVKAYYKKQKTMGLNQQEIYINIVSWLNSKSKQHTSDATEIVASFFIQNCEVF